MNKLLIVNQPACSNVFLVGPDGAKRILQSTYDRCFTYARGYADALGLEQFYITAKSGDCMRAVTTWMNSPVEH